MVLSVAKRVGRNVVVVLLVTMAAVALLSLAPGSAAAVILGDNATPDAIAALNARLGLDLPIWQQYLNWLGNAVTGDLGTSPVTNEPVIDAVLARLPVTLELAALALVISVVVAVILAVVSANWRDTVVDRVITALSSILLSVPAFIAGPLLVYFLAMQLGWFPVSGWARIGTDGLAANFSSAIMPALAISLIEIAAFHRILRSDLISTLREDFVGAARAKGMSQMSVMFRHALRPSSFSLVTLVGINLGRLIGGTVVVETLFSLPGLGQLIVSSITSRDVISMQGIVVFVVVVYVVINMIVDFSYNWLDPRVRKAAV